MILFYRVLTHLIYPFLFIIVFLRVFLKKEDPKRYKEKILISHFYVKRNYDQKLIWFHAASIGEVQSIIPIINQLNKKNDKFNFLVTTITFSSGKYIKEELKHYNNVAHRYLPIDVNFLIKKFITIWKPYVVFFVDSEIWPNLILNLKPQQKCWGFF